VARDLTPAGRAEIQKLSIKFKSKALALEVFADSPHCPEPISEAIKNAKTPYQAPLSLFRAANVTPEVQALYHGPRQAQHIGFKSRHNNLVMDPITKELRPLRAGDIYISDDMSRNKPFWFELPEHDRITRQGRGDKLAAKHGVAIGRQTLCTIDATGKVLGISLIGCARDAYNAADVLRHFRQIYTVNGKPSLAHTLEKGVWASDAIDGTSVVCDNDEKARLIGHLSQLGFEVQHAHTSEGKALIETFFNHFQKFQSGIAAGVDIGRFRGENERQTKLIQRVQAGTLHPRDAGLEHISEAMENDIAAMNKCNNREKFGRIQYGVPEQRWIVDTSKHPLRKLLPSENGVFMPTKLETKIREGHLEKKIGGTTYRFTISSLFAQLGDGYRLFMCFDETNPQDGAELYNLETGSRNVFNWSPRQYIGHADWSQDRNFYGFTTTDAEGVENSKAHKRAVTTAFASTGLSSRKSIEQRDGKGKVALVEINKTSPDAQTPTLPDLSRRSSVVLDGPQPDARTSTPLQTTEPVRRKTKIKSRLELMGVLS
jgi:hypothetical protein